jgi:peptidoglycan hydrolase-like protein with peptidoglycan-binding domain
MTQNNPNLSLNQQSEDVALLQSRLMNIGYTIATSEILNKFFGQSTYQAVMHFQQREGLRTTGVVDATTAQAIVNRFESDKTVLMHKPPTIPPQATFSAPTGSENASGKPIEIVRESSPPPMPSKSGDDNIPRLPTELAQSSRPVPDAAQ